MNTIPRPPLRRVFGWQLLASLLISSALYLKSAVAGYSFLTGCLIQLVGNLYFARLAFRYMGARASRLAVQSMYRGETGKIVLMVAMFAIVFATLKPLNYLAVFAGYAVMHAMYLVLAAKLLQQRITLTNRP